MVILEGESFDIEKNLWAKKLEYLYHNQSLFQSIGENAQKFILNHYNASKNIVIYEKEFNNLI